MKLSPAILTLLGLYLGTLTEAANLYPGQKILLSKVGSLTLRNDQVTKSRRVDPIPQLKCVGGDGKGRYEVDVMRCKNQGSDYGDGDISWACSASLPREFKLGATDVICEGYDDPDDNYILKGSCGVEYRLALTDAGYEKFGYSTFSKITGGNNVNWGFWIFFFGVLGWVIYALYSNTNTRNGGAPRTRPNGGRPWFWGSGGGGGGGNDSPPPYDPRPPPKPRYSSQQGSGPGFWTGAATGAAAGAAGSYLMGGRNREREGAAANYGYTPSYSGASSYGGPSGGQSGGESSSAGSSSAGARHTSTGFGQTRRR